MRYVFTAERIRQAENKTIINGTSSIELMNRASNALLSHIDTTLRTAIVCGGGNNGGDGISLACDLRKINKCADLILVSEVKTDSAKYYLKIARDSGVNIIEYNSEIDFNQYQQIVDCIFGIGLTREPEGRYAEVIDKINNANAMVIACDIPSGLNASNGVAGSHTIRADKTISFGDYKVGHFLNDAKDYVGKLYNDDIGIFQDKPQYMIYDKDDFKLFFTNPKQNIHKYINGKLTIIGGSKNYIGAPLLANMSQSALRVGAGLATIAVPSIISDSVKERILDSTLFTLSTFGDTIKFCESEINEAIAKSKAVAVGVGMSRSVEVTKTIDYLLGKDIKLLIDADGIVCLSDNIDSLSTKSADTIITPHIAEFSKLSGYSVNDIKNNPIEIAEQFARKYNVVVLLKGASTIITNGVDTAISPYGNSSLSKGGTGDTLSGIIVGLLARGIDTFSAGVLGSYILGRAGEILSEELTSFGVLASDIPTAIPYVIKEIINDQ